jgi:hypothetical protein
VKLPGPSSPVYGRVAGSVYSKKSRNGKETHVVGRRTAPPQPFPRRVLRRHRIWASSSRTRSVVTRLPPHPSDPRTGVKTLGVGVLVGESSSVRRSSSGSTVRRRRSAKGGLHRRVDGPCTSAALLLRLLLELRLGGGRKEGRGSGAGLLSLSWRVFEGALVGVVGGIACIDERERRVRKVRFGSDGKGVASPA